MNNSSFGKPFENENEIIDLPFCRVFLEDNSFFPWILLAPKKSFVKNMLGLTTEERLILMREIEICEKVMDSLFSPFQLNIAIIGNKRPQLHVHIIARYENDKCFPETVWGRASTPYKEKEKKEIIYQIGAAIEKLSIL